MTLPVTPPGLSRGRTLLFAVAAGAAVGNLYWAQPLLELIARDLHAAPASAGWLITATQIGYAIGILLIVPLGDVLPRHRLVPTVLGCTAVALVGCAAAPSLPVLLGAIFVLGLATVGGQLLTPLAGDLAGDEARGRVVGIVVSGILVGILASRTISGLVADVAGWRTVYLGAAALSVALAVLLARTIPRLPPKASRSYPALIGSVFTIIAREPVVRWTLAMGSTAFAAFTMFWTALTFLLSAEPFSYSVTTIGLFGFAGLAGAIAAQRAGGLHDRGWSMPATGVAWALGAASFLLAWAGGRSAPLVVVAIVLVDAAIQGLNLLNQTRLFAVSHAARSRLNTAFVTANFLGGAVGSALAGVLWAAGGWTAVCLAGLGLCLVGTLVWAVGARVLRVETDAA